MSHHFLRRGYFLAILCAYILTILCGTCFVSALAQAQDIQNATQRVGHLKLAII